MAHESARDQACKYETDADSGTKAAIRKIQTLSDPGSTPGICEHMGDLSVMDVSENADERREQSSIERNHVQNQNRNESRQKNASWLQTAL